MGRAAVFIDGANLFFTQRHLGWQIDFSRLMAFFMSGYAAVQANYYVPASEPVSEENAAFTRVLTAHGYRITSKPVKKIVNKETGVIIMKGNLDVELVVDAMSGADQYDTFILFSGDSDFLPLLRALKERGKEVIVYSTQGLSARELLAEPGIAYYDFPSSGSVSNSSSRENRCVSMGLWQVPITIFLYLFPTSEKPLPARCLKCSLTEFFSAIPFMPNACFP
jgi:uncharacterized LabA/DUF88 family protein